MRCEKYIIKLQKNKENRLSLLEKEWDKFKSAVIPDDASDEQVEDMMSAFFAGAIVITSMITKAVKDKDIGAANKIQDEIMEYVKSIFKHTNQDTDTVFKDAKAEKVDLKNYVKEIKQKDIEISFNKDNVFGIKLDLSAEGIKKDEQSELKLMLNRDGDIDVIVCFESGKCYKVHTIHFHEWEFKK